MCPLLCKAHLGSASPSSQGCRRGSLLLPGEGVSGWDALPAGFQAAQGCEGGITRELSKEFFQWSCEIESISTSPPAISSGSPSP